MKTKKRDWPFRYLVKIHTISKEVFQYKVTTWLYEEKAIALATIEHRRKYSDIHKKAIYNIEVEKIGLVEETPEGMASIPPGDLGDRMEF